VTLASRLWSRCERQPNGCLEWQGSTVQGGYGRIYSGPPEKRLILTHRAAWQLANGPIPDALVVRHSCDNPPCCDPGHLLTGTQRQNVEDAVSRGRARGAVGERNSHANLTESQVIEIRGLLVTGLYQYVIGSMFGVGQSAISQINRRETWGNV
jgi:hypothetical protein